jgi:hypothetical protein
MEHSAASEIIKYDIRNQTEETDQCTECVIEYQEPTWENNAQQIKLCTLKYQLLNIKLLPLPVKLAFLWCTGYHAGFSAL